MRAAGDHRHTKIEAWAHQGGTKIRVSAWWDHTGEHPDNPTGKPGTWCYFAWVSLEYKEFLRDLGDSHGGWTSRYWKTDRELTDLPNDRFASGGIVSGGERTEACVMYQFPLIKRGLPGVSIYRSFDW